MNHSKETKLAHAILGDDLRPVFDEYVEIIESVEPGAPDVKIPYYSQVAADRVSAAVQKLPTNASYEQFTQAVEKAGHSTISAREKVLHDKGFVGSLARLFESILEIEEVAEDAQKLEQLKAEAEVFKRVPEERQKAAIVVSGGAYYWGGRYVPLEVENKKGDK